MEMTSKINAPPSIMIVDDIPANLEVLSDALTENGYRVRSAPSGRLALQAAHRDPPDLILLDIMMPEMDGYEVCRKLKEDGATRDIPVIFITAMDRAMDEERGLSLGAVDYISKPIRLPIVLARVQNHLLMKMQRDGIEAQVMARTAELDAANRELKSEITVRIRAEEERERTLIQQDRVNLLQQSLLAPAPLDRKLRSITDSIVRIFDADFCRIWLIRPGDRCEQGCVHEQVHEGPHVCRFRNQCLHLVSSSGRYTHIDGEGHRRVPFGCYKIGLIASGEEHKFITNDVQNDPRVHNHEWARELGLVSFAGYQLRVTGGQTLGVLALFARRPIAPEEDAMLDGVSSTVALVVQQAEGQEALSISEEKYRKIVEELKTEYFFYRHDTNGVFTYVSPSIAYVLGYSTEEFCAHFESFLTDSPVNRDVIEHTARSIQGMQQEPYEVEIRHRDGSVHHLEVLESPAFDADGRVAAVDGIAHDITERKQAEMELRGKNEELDLLLNSMGSIIIGVSVKDRITHWNPFAEELFGIKSNDIVGKELVGCHLDWDWKRVYEAISLSISEDRTERLDDLKYIRRDGKDGLLGLSINPLKRGGEDLVGFIILGRDLTERRKLENQLLQARKLEAIGQLAAGVAHEINSPLQYVGDNLKFIAKALHEIIDLQKRFVEQMESVSSGHDCRDASASLREHMKAIDLEYLMQELPRAAEQSLDGVTRVSKIVQSMKAFAHPGTGSKLPANINKSIENTATVSRNEWKYDCELSLDLEPSLPPVPCFEAELNQVVLNLIVNAVDAVRDAKAKKIREQGIIRISTRLEDGYAVLRIADNGTGIPDEIREKIFDPFFTTKEVGKGTGQGLAISHSIIVDKHGGSLDFESEPGKGTAFIIKLPLSME